MAMSCIINSCRECDGCGECLGEEPAYVCPICAAEADTYYVRDGIVIGCECCITAKAVEDVEWDYAV